MKNISFGLRSTYYLYSVEMKIKTIYIVEMKIETIYIVEMKA